MRSGVFRVFAGFMVLIYIGVGILLLLAKQLYENFPSFAQPLFGIVLIIYGCFRFYRLLREMWLERKGDVDQYEEEDGKTE
jgi:cytochrome c biogenesis protein CcdA